MKVKKFTHLINIATIFDFFYSDIEMSNKLKENFKQLFNNTYKEVKKELLKAQKEYNEKLRRV